MEKNNNEKSKQPPSRMVWISITLNVVFVLTAWGIATDRVMISVKPMQIVSNQPQVTLAGLPNPYLAGR